MKLKTISKFKYKPVKFKFYQNFNTIKIYLRKIINVIFQYHIKNKTILFIGADKKMLCKVKTTNHIFLPKYYWIKGLLTNKITVFKYLKNNINNFAPSKIKGYFLLKNKIDLIVVFKKQNQNTIKKEALKLKIPLIMINPPKVCLTSSLLHLKHNNLYNKTISFCVTLALNSILKQNIKNKHV